MYVIGNVRLKLLDVVGNALTASLVLCTLPDYRLDLVDTGIFFFLGDTPERDILKTLLPKLVLLVLI
jgi:hypothetical protein